jgi:hypothetical protein
MTFGLRCSQPAGRPHPASLPVRVPTVESLLRASFSFTSRLRLAFRYGCRHQLRRVPLISIDSAHAGHTGAVPLDRSRRPRRPVAKSGSRATRGRGRDASCPAPPAQSRAGATNAHGSCLGYGRLASKRTLAASRTRASPCDPQIRHGVRYGLGSGVFSLASGLPSTTPACGLPLLFGCFTSTTPLYDSPLPCMVILSLIAFSTRPAYCSRAATGLPVLARPEGTRFLCMLGVSDSAGSPAHSRFSCAVAWPSDGLTPWASWNTVFGAQYPAYRYPCPTLQVQPRDCPHMARGQGDSLFLPCTTLAFRYSMPFIPALSRPGGLPREFLQHYHFVGRLTSLAAERNLKSTDTIV